jgi:Na+/melibiose symporter-like transporter
MMADVADYGEWKHGRRATGVVFSAVVFGLKAGLGVGGAIGGYILAAYGYVPNVAQTERALDGIRLSIGLLPALGFALCIVCLLFYGIDKTMEIRITNDLALRRSEHRPKPALAGAGT